MTCDFGARLTQQQGPSGTNALAYDAAARLTKETGPSAPQTGFGYYANGQITSIRETSPTGTLFQFTTYLNDAAGNRVGINDSNGSLTTYVNDAKYRLIADHTSGTNAHDYAYSYNGKDNILTNNESGGTITLAYSLAGRITTALSSSGTSSYTYDANGNLHLVQDPASTTTMLYDKENQLVVHQSGSSVASYTYSGDNLKRNELVDGVSTTLIWDGSNYLGGKH